MSFTPNDVWLRFLHFNGSIEMVCIFCSPSFSEKMDVWASPEYTGGLGLESPQSGCDRGELGPVGDQSLALALSRPLRRGGRCHLGLAHGWRGRPS